MICTNERLAEDAEELVWLDIEDLAPNLDPSTDREMFDEDHGNVAASIERRYGDVEGAFRDARTVVELDLSIGRHTGVPLECRGGVAVVDEQGILHLYGAAKVPHYNRSAIARMLGWDSRRIVLSEGHVGGGFGVRGELYPEDVLLCVAADALGRPVKWIEDRREHLVATNHSRDQHHRVRAAVDETGFITAVDDEFFLDQGAYVRTHAASVPNISMAMLPGPYVWPAFRTRCQVVLTNKTPAGTYRAPGRYEGTFVRERLLDAVGAALKMSPIEIRRRNLISREDMPFSRGLEAIGGEITLDTGDYAGLMDRALGLWAYDRAKSDAAEARSRGEHVGVGVAMFVEKSAPKSVETVRIESTDSATVRVITGAGSVGQGMETILAQICGEEIGLELSDIEVVHGQTDQIERGMGVFASRVSVMTGSATHLAACEFRAKMLALAGERFNIVPEHLSVTGELITRSDGGTLISVRDLLSSMADDVVLVAEATFDSDSMTYPYGVHMATVSVDKETGQVDVLRYCIAYDVGRAINPLLVKGQLVGAAAQGIGGALYEEFRYDESGQPLATSFMDYLLPTASEMPEFEILISEDAPTTLNPLGVKGAGEGGITAVGAAIAAAIDDALEESLMIRQLPATPERVVTAYRSSHSRSLLA